MGLVDVGRWRTVTTLAVTFDGDRHRPDAACCDALLIALKVARSGDGLPEGQVRRRGVAVSGVGSGVWAWGPVPVRACCGDHLYTPYDDVLGGGCESRSEVMPSGWAAQMAAAFPVATGRSSSGEPAPGRERSSRHELDELHATGDPGASGA